MKQPKHTRLRININISGLLIGFFLLSQAFASDYQSPRTLSLGGSGHAGPLLNDSIYLNPAFCSLLPSYSISGNTSSAKGDSGAYKLWNLSVQDGRTELFQAGVGYTRRSDLNIIHVGASHRLFTQSGLGISGKYLIERNGTIGNGNKATQELTLSYSIIPLGWMQMSFLADNLIQGDMAKSYGFFREYTLGLKVNSLGIVLLYIDPHYTPSLESGRYGLEAGLEFPIMSDFFLRTGMFRNANMSWQYNKRGKGYSAGAGWMAPRLSLDYGYSHSTQPNTESVHSFGATIYF